MSVHGLVEPLASYVIAWLDLLRWSIVIGFLLPLLTFKIMELVTSAPPEAAYALLGEGWVGVLFYGRFDRF